MTPRITRQTKVLIKDKHGNMDSSSANATKFIAMDPVPTVSSMDIGNIWMEPIAAGLKKEERGLKVLM